MVRVSLQDADEISWRAIRRGLPVVGSDGERLGGVSRLLGDPGRDIFSGIAFRRHLLAPECELPLEDIVRITAVGIIVRLDAAGVEERLRAQAAQRARRNRWGDD